MARHMRMRAFLAGLILAGTMAAPVTTVLADEFEDARQAYLLLLLRGDLAEASEAAGKAAAIAEERFGQTDTRVALALSELGAIETRRGEADLAVDHLERALEIRRMAEAEEPALVVGSFAALAEAQTAAGEPATAIATVSAGLGWVRAGKTLDAAIQEALDTGSIRTGRLVSVSRRVAAQFYNAGRFDLSRPVHDAIPDLIVNPDKAAFDRQINEFLYDQISATADPEDDPVWIGKAQSEILLDLPEAREVPVRASWQDARVARTDVLHVISREMVFLVVLVQADPGMAVGRSGTYSPERLIDELGVMAPEVVRWSEEGEVPASFASLSYRLVTMDGLSCGTFGGTFAPTASAGQSKELLGMLCRPAALPVAAADIRRFVAHIGVRGYALPMGR